MTWHYLWTNQDEMPWADKYDNASEIWNLLTITYGWTEEASSAVISNFQHEGLLNPAQWQIGSTIGHWNNDEVGLGLGQWTPANKLGTYCGGNTQQAISDGAKQVQFTVETPGQWVQRVNSNGYSSYYREGGVPYITSITQFGQSSLEPEDLAICWCMCWEGCSRDAYNLSKEARRTDARYWYNEFSGTPHAGHRIRLHAQGNCEPYATLHLEDTQRIYYAEAGTDVFIHANVGAGDYFEIWTVDSGGVTIDFDTQPNTFFTMHDSDVDITAHATGSPPTPPTPTGRTVQTGNMPIWMYPIFR